MRLNRILFLSCILWCLPALSQTKTIDAFRTSSSPRIDGDFDENVWANAPIISSFVQNFPTFGLQASSRTEVRIAYDDDAIYVYAYLFDDPSNIRKQLTPRDEEQQSDADHFAIFFDTYHDRQNGFQFLVTSMNVQTDARLGPNLGGGFGSFGDKTWDAVWESQVKMKDDGWVVEMRIPYLSLRFSKKEVQDWGLQILRFTRRNNESSYWNPVNPEVNGFVNQFGDLKNLLNIQPPLRLSFSPYVSTGVRVTPQPTGENKTEWLRSGGMDVKYGINESFTLDVTLIPDFGQVVSDNVINNLTPFEVRFQENRPFFTEGTELFNKAGLFYSRRVGEEPEGYRGVRNYVADTSLHLEALRNPATTQLYNAIKFSGRTKRKLGIGIFNAITAPMSAIIRDHDTNEEVKIETEPLANYNIIVLDQALKGRSYVTLTNTNVIRNAEARDANVTAFDFNFFDKENIHSLRGTARYSRIFGPDAYDGFNTSLNFSKVSGNLQYYLQGNIESSQYDPTDLGYLQSPNEIVYNAGISFNQFTPTKTFLNYNYGLDVRYARLYDPNAFSDVQIELSTFLFFKNFWDVSVTLGTLPADQHDYFVLGIPGRYVKRPSYSFGEIEGSTDSRRKLFVRYGFVGALFHNEDKDYSSIDLGVRYRFSNRLSMEVSAAREGETDYIVNAGYEANGDPIIGFVDFTDITTVLSGIYHFTPRINLTLRARHYWSQVLYNRFANVDAKGNPIPRAFIPDQDENVNVFNLDAFFTWDFRLGSRLIAGYKNWLGDNFSVNGAAYSKYIKNFGQTFQQPHGNEFTVRFIYFLDYNQLRKKK